MIYIYIIIYIKYKYNAESPPTFTEPFILNMEESISPLWRTSDIRWFCKFSPCFPLLFSKDSEVKAPTAAKLTVQPGYRWCHWPSRVKNSMANKAWKRIWSGKYIMVHIDTHSTFMSFMSLHSRSLNTVQFKYLTLWFKNRVQPGSLKEGLRLNDNHLKEVRTLSPCWGPLSMCSALAGRENSKPLKCNAERRWSASFIVVLFMILQSVTALVREARSTQKWNVTSARRLAPSITFFFSENKPLKTFSPPVRWGLLEMSAGPRPPAPPQDLNCKR